MTAVDYVVLLVVGTSTIGGVAKGFARSVITTVAAIVGCFLSSSTYGAVGMLIRPMVETERMAHFLGFLTVYLLTLLAGIFLARVLRKAFEKTRLGWLDHLMGGGFGLVRGWAVCSVAYIALAAFPIKVQWIREGATLLYLQKGAIVITTYASSYIEAQLKAFLEAPSKEPHEPAPPQADTK
jgi:membrane protein required for colicin V production